MKPQTQIFNQEEVFEALNKVENNEFIKEKFLPCLPLIVSGKEYTSNEVTEYFVIGIKVFFENRVNSEVIALILYGNIQKYISAAIAYNQQFHFFSFDCFCSKSATCEDNFSRSLVKSWP